MFLYAKLLFETKFFSQLTAFASLSLYFLTDPAVLLAYLHMLKYIDQEHPKEKEAPPDSSSGPWQAQLLGVLAALRRQHGFP